MLYPYVVSHLHFISHSSPSEKSAVLKDLCAEATIDEVHHPQDVTCQGDAPCEDHMLRVDALLKTVGNAMPGGKFVAKRVAKTEETYGRYKIYMIFMHN